MVKKNIEIKPEKSVIIKSLIINVKFSVTDNSPNLELYGEKWNTDSFKETCKESSSLSQLKCENQVLRIVQA